MSRKIIVGLLALAVVVVGVWLIVHRARGHHAKPAEDHARSAAIPAPAEPSPKQPEPGPAPRGLAPRWSFDADPEGPLRLEGQVLDAEGKGVGGAEVWLGSVPAKTARTEDDGAFSFDKLVGRTYSISAQKGELMGGPSSTS